MKSVHRASSYRAIRHLDHQYLLALQVRLLSRPLEIVELALVEQALLEKRSIATAIVYRFAALLLLIVDSAFGILRDLFWVLTASVGNLFAGILSLSGDLRDREIKRAAVNACHCVLVFLYSILGWFFDLLLRLIRTAIDILDTSIFGRPQRTLSTQERRLLDRLFGSSLCYPLARISYGCPSLRIMTPHVAGNVMYLPQRQHLLDSSGELGQSGQALLFHEATHVWQHHNGGGSYMHRALAAQLMGSIFKGGRGYAYDWRRALHEGVEFELLNPEQQAQLAQEIGVQLSVDNPKTIWFDNVMEQQYAERALACLQSGNCRI